MNRRSQAMHRAITIERAGLYKALFIGDLTTYPLYYLEFYKSLSPNFGATIPQQGLVYLFERVGFLGPESRLWRSGDVNHMRTSKPYPVVAALACLSRLRQVFIANSQMRLFSFLGQPVSTDAASQEWGIPASPVISSNAPASILADPFRPNEMLALISKVFSWAVDEEIIQASPAIRLPRPGEEKDRERVLRAEEIGRLWPAFAELGYPFGDLYKIMLCTAQRRGEVASMKWSQLGPDGWRLPASSAKTKVGHLVPLSTLARAILEGLPQIGEHVFIARQDAPLQGWSKAKTRIDLIITLDEPWQVEDTRRTAATHMRSLGVDRHCGR